MRVLKSKKSKVAVTTVAMLALGGGAAYAYWTAGGSGVGSGTTGTSTNFTMTSTAATGAALIPGIGSQSVAFAVTNPSTGTQTLSNVVVTVANPTTEWTAVSGCSAADYTVGVPVIAYGPILTAAVVTGTVSISMNNTATNQNACQGAAYPLRFVLS